MLVLNLSSKRRGKGPNRRAKHGAARNWSPATIMDAFVFYGKDISEERFQYYMQELKRIGEG